jgi:hypothetical protein
MITGRLSSKHPTGCLSTEHRMERRSANQSLATRKSRPLSGCREMWVTLSSRCSGPTYEPEAPAKDPKARPSLALQACEGPVANVPSIISSSEAVCQRMIHAHAEGVIRRDFNSRGPARADWAAGRSENVLAEAIGGAWRASDGATLLESSLVCLLHSRPDMRELEQRPMGRFE